MQSNTGSDIEWALYKFTDNTENFKVVQLYYPNN